MDLHFYTTYDNIQMLREGDPISVWTKDNASPYDIHVSINMDKYAFHQVEKGTFTVSLI